MPRGFEASGVEQPIMPGAENGLYDLSFVQAVGGIAAQAHAWNRIGERSVSVKAAGHEGAKELTEDTCWECPTTPPDCDITESGCTEQGCATDPDMTCGDTCDDTCGE